ncbi:lysophospholipid acyltransferase family protein [Flavisolibacter nicotianae]|uniref:lysophospholipid acyltransferase family protein n=1 Tax=Flavisolibacter nicotianae TaxID=2364882 RepID=UPI000EB34E43|nr:lysophospholipid acyltransferase family protein [Flavisolibacter nicotianae]
MRYLLKFLQRVYVLYALVLFVILMIPVFIWSLVATLFGRIRAGNLVYAACMVWADLWFALVLIRHKNVFYHKPARSQSYIFVANHISYLDAALVPKVFRRPVRPLGKVEMARVPVFGTIYKNAIVSVDRSSSANRTKSVQVLKSILRKGISVLVFPEGTFNETGRPLKSFYNGAFRIAIETGTPVQPVLFLDSYSRMKTTAFLSLNPGRSRAVFLAPIPVDQFTLKDVTLLKNKVYEVMDEELRKHGAEWITEE